MTSLVPHHHEISGRGPNVYTCGHHDHTTFRQLVSITPSRSFSFVKQTLWSSNKFHWPTSLRSQQNINTNNTMASLRSVSQSSRPLFRAASLLRTPLRVRQFQSGASTRQEVKGESRKPEDRSTLNPRSSEYTMSGFDGDVVEKSDTSFNPNNTTPEEEFAKAGNGNNVLEVSGANREISKCTDEKCDEKTMHRKDRSVESKPSRKHGKFPPGGGHKA
ncbi:hypothetical protein QBC43DRAFT_313831 [Cladorrhinum sp. PSN259]|nr:hypothetical protein QBC43DRAFT_313831 [Cladorrhinum sp. PSN259]